MITNKDISIDSENGKITLNGNKYDLGTQGEIDTAVKDVYSVMGQNGAKNLIPYPYYETTKTINGITFTDNGDGTITANGTATGAAQFGLVSRISSNYYLPNGSYTVTGCPNTSGCQIRVGRTVNNADSQYGQDTGNGLTFTRTDATNAMGIALQIASGTTVSNLTFKPMLRLASDTDNTYEPYAMTNKQLTETIGDLTQTGITGATVAAQLETIGDQLDIEHITNLSIDTSKITIGTYDCYVKAGVCYLSLYSCSFLASGSVSASISNLPKSLVQALSPGYGTSANAADLISEYGWIAGNSTTISFTVSEANKSKNRDYYLVYPVATS